MRYVLLRHLHSTGAEAQEVRGPSQATWTVCVCLGWSQVWQTPQPIL